MGFKMGMDAHVMFSNSLLLDWMLEVCMKYVTLLHQAIGGCTYATVFSSKKWRKIKTKIPTAERITVITLQ